MTDSTDTTRGGSSQGPAVDSVGTPVIDPTQNVLQLVEAAIERQDDLRAASERHTRDLIDIHANHSRELAAKETARIDAIRAVDVGAVSRAAEVSATQATTLAQQVATSAETLRGQVSAAATATATALATALEPIIKRIEELSRVQYEQQGQRTQQTESKGTNQWAVGFAMSAFVAFLSLAGLVIVLVTTK